MIEVYKYDSVTEEEMTKLLLKHQFRNLFSMLDELHNEGSRLNIDFPLKWLISSIDRRASDGKLRYEIQKGNHKDSRAVDIVPIINEQEIRLPIPLNRNLLLMDLFTAKMSLIPLSTLPLIAFEADHIHCDINGPPGLYRLKKVRSFFDSLMHNALAYATAGTYWQALNNGELVKIL